jgi:hypothetical protein
MSQDRELLARFGQETALDPAEERALLTALEERGLLPGPEGAVLDTATRPRGKPRLRPFTAPRPRSPVRTWGLAAAGLVTASLAAIAVALFLVRGPTSPTQAPLALDEVLHSPEQTTEREPIPTMALSYQGRGTLAGDRTAPRLGWESGRVEIEVIPQTGTQLTVRTREALIQVVGTAFTVTRTGPRTDVEVHRGQVDVRCAAGGGADLLAGQSHRCGPASEAGWLALAHQLHSPSANPDHALQAIESGLSVSDPAGLVTTELLALRAQVLTEAGRLDEALDAVGIALERPHRHRRQQLLALGVAVAEAVGERRTAAAWQAEIERSDQSGALLGPLQ